MYYCASNAYHTRRIVYSCVRNTHHAQEIVYSCARSTYHAQEIVHSCARNEQQTTIVCEETHLEYETLFKNNRNPKRTGL